jgi:hypothetical protein
MSRERSHECYKTSPPIIRSDPLKHKYRKRFPVIQFYRTCSENSVVGSGTCISGGRGLEGLQAINRAEETLAAIPDHSPNRVALFEHLGHLFQTRYQRLENIDDLKAIKWTDAEIANTQEDSHRPCKLKRLGEFHAVRHFRLQDVEDLVKAISLTEEVLATTSLICSSREVCALALSSLLHTRYHLLESKDDIDRAIKWGEGVL